MELKELLEKIASYRKGSYTKLVYETTKEIKNKGILKKKTSMVGRLGINYYKMKENIHKEISPRLWGENMDGFENYIVEHTKDGVTNYYLKVFVSKNKNHKAKTNYIFNGEETTKQKLLEEKIIRENKIESTFTINIKNIVSLG